MPPTDVVKKLSRTDLLALGFSEFLQVQGIIGKGDEDVFINPVPYTSVIPFVTNLCEARFYQCFAMSVCIPSKTLAPKHGHEMRYNENLVALREDVAYLVEKDTLHILDLNNSVIQIFTKSRLEKIKVFDVTLKSRYVPIPDTIGEEICGVHAVALYSDKLELSLASSEPMTIELLGGHVVKLFIPSSSILLVSSKPYQQLLRDVYVYSNVISVRGSIRSSQALVEVIDPITLVQPRVFEHGCVDLMLLNPEDIDYNAMIKVYGYIDEVVIDELTRFKPRHSILRIALPKFARSKLRLCLSTFIPRRADIVYKLKLFEPASL